MLPQVDTANPFHGVWLVRCRIRVEPRMYQVIRGRLRVIRLEEQNILYFRLNPRLLIKGHPVAWYISLEGLVISPVKLQRVISRVLSMVL